MLRLILDNRDTESASLLSYLRNENFVGFSLSAGIVHAAQPATCLVLDLNPEHPVHPTSYFYHTIHNTTFFMDDSTKMTALVRSRNADIFHCISH